MGIIVLTRLKFPVLMAQVLPATLLMAALGMEITASTRVSLIAQQKPQVPPVPPKQDAPGMDTIASMQVIVLLKLQVPPAMQHQDAPGMGPIARLQILNNYIYLTHIPGRVF